MNAQDRKEAEELIRVQDAGPALLQAAKRVIESRRRGHIPQSDIDALQAAVDQAEGRR